MRKDHPLRAVRAMVDEVLKQLLRRFDAMYAKVGLPSIPPEQLLRAQLLQMLCSIRSERLLMEEIDYRMLFRWFIGLNDVAREFLAQIVEQARAKGLTSDTVDGTLLEAWAGRRVFSRRTRSNHRRRILVIPRRTSAARGGGMRRTHRKPTLGRFWREKGKARSRN